MALDPVPTYPGNYNASEASNNPPGSDTRREGDDQIRRMKASEKATWSNVTGAVTASHTELNTLTGISTTDPITTFPSGTKMVFHQLSAPTDWTLDATLNEHSIALVGATGGGTTGGTKNFTTVFQTHAEGAADGVGDHTLVLAEIPAHNHGGGAHAHVLNYATGDGTTAFATGSTFGNRVAGGANYASSGVSGSRSGFVASSGSIITSQGGSGAHGHSLDLDVKRANCIVATKD